MDTTTKIESALVIGGCGNLGHKTVEQLLKLDPTPRISVFDVQTAHNRFPSVEYYNVDITDTDQVYSALSQVRPDVIFHTASPSSILRDLPLYLRVNVEGTRNLLECAKGLGVKAFVYTSSASVVHDSATDLTEGDDSLPLVYMPVQREPYGHSKALADKLVLEANSNATGKMKTVSIRPSGIFGEADFTAQAFADNAKEGKSKFQVGSGKNQYDWTFNENVIYAHLLAAQALLKSHIYPPDEDMRVAGEAFLITNDEHIGFWDFARAIGDAAGYPTRIEDVTTVPRSVGIAMAWIAEWGVWATSFGRRKSRLNMVGVNASTLHRTFRIDKAKRVLGYKPLVSLQEGITRSGKACRTFQDQESKKTA